MGFLFWGEKNQFKKKFNQIKLKDLQGLLKILDKKNHQYIKDIFSCTGKYKDKKII